MATGMATVMAKWIDGWTGGMVAATMPTIDNLQGLSAHPRRTISKNGALPKTLNCKSHHSLAPSVPPFITHGADAYQKDKFIMRICNVHSMLWLHGHPNPFLSIQQQSQDTGTGRRRSQSGALPTTIHLNSIIGNAADGDHDNTGLPYTFNRITNFGPDAPNQGTTDQINKHVDESIIPRLLNQLSNGYNVLLMATGNQDQGMATGLFERCLDYLEDLKVAPNDLVSYRYFLL